MKFRSALFPLLLLALPAWGQTYRCVAPNGSVAYQDRPCTGAAKQSRPAAAVAPRAAPAGGPTVRPKEGMSAAQKRDLEALEDGYVEFLYLIGRAKACNQDAGRLEEFLQEIERRHGGEGKVATLRARLSFYDGEANRPMLQGEQPTPPPSCEDVRARATLKLPDIPPSLVLQANRSSDDILQEGRASTGPYRLLKRTPPRGAAEYLLLHRDQVVYRSSQTIQDRSLVEVEGGPTPVMVLSSVDHARKCGDGAPYRKWLVVSLPISGTPLVSNLDADCMVVFRGLGKQPKKRLCAWMRTDIENRPSRLYRIDAMGKPVSDGEWPAGTCPK